ncbi:hypothetical protein AYO21_02061 [Fonsecaea monophora]|uniref:Protein kinase domain-containing protein n=1 Tax=Fonsecaea monophora TaxID=254056 RepID=A0A177FHQ4_9EURO|nr:hypothetical protein AYO21_02061 [Fonsecaea monophora]OAG43834.1 hypothetical protein AYO21_02061 [Fonsecaea monophora]
MVDDIKLLMIGMSSETYRIGNKVANICHVLLDDPAITQQNLEAYQTESLVYQILGEHPRIGRVELEFYPNGNLKDYLEKNYSSTTEVDKKRWALQMIESVFYIHSKGVRHADLRLDQWLLDQGNARLWRAAQGLECSSHWLPRPDDVDSSVQTDLFALGSSLYELMAGQMPFARIDDHTIDVRYAERIFPTTEGLSLGIEITRCWNQAFTTAEEFLNTARSKLSEATETSFSVDITMTPSGMGRAVEEEDIHAIVDSLNQNVKPNVYEFEPAVEQKSCPTINHPIRYPHRAL